VRPTFRHPIRLSTPVRLTIGAIMLLLIGSIVLVSRAGATATPPSIPGLGTIQMRDTGLSIAAPNMSPAIDQATALKALPALPDNAQILQVVLANVTDNHRVPPMHCLCYVVSITPQSPPSDGPSNHPQPPGTFTLELVDSATGRYLEKAGN
jgi:hypothetical protein